MERYQQWITSLKVTYFQLSEKTEIKNYGFLQLFTEQNTIHKLEIFKTADNIHKNRCKFIPPSDWNAQAILLTSISMLNVKVHHCGI